jgi:PAS domain S-box-containing protein
MLNSSKKSVRAGLGVALGVVIGISASSYWVTHKLIVAQQWREEPLRVRTRLEESLFDLSVAESARQAYFIRNDKRFLRLYNSAVRDVSRTLAALQVLVQNQPANEQRDFASFKHLIQQRVMLMEQSAATPDSTQPSATLQPVALSDQGQLLGQAIVGLADKMKLDQRQKALAWEAESGRHYRYAVGSLTLGTLFSVLLVLGTLYLFDREEKRGSEAEEALTLTQERLRLLVESVKDYAIFALDSTGRVVSWNAGAGRINGYQLSEIFGRHFSCFYTPEDIAQGKPDAALRVATEAGRFEEEAWRVRKDGSRFWANVVITPWRDASGELRGFAKVTRDISERKQAEEELQQREELMNAFFAASPMGLAILDTDFRFQRVNATLSAMTGQTVEACHEKTIDEVMCGFASQVKLWLEQVAATGTPVLNCELSGQRPGDGAELGHWITSYFPVISRNGQLRQIGAIMVDITERTRAEEALRESEDTLRRLSAQLIRIQDDERRRLARELHDSVGQCLAALKINLEVLHSSGQELALDGKPGRALSEALTLADQCLTDTRTISHLLHPPLLDRVGLPSALRWYVDGFVERSGIRVKLHLPPSFTRLEPDLETTLFRIVQESLTNIHRHSGSPTAEIRLAADAESVMLEVTDHGGGIPPERLRRCNGGRAALGVGIAGMRERVRQFGGHLEVRSSPQGTTIQASLPAGGIA